MDWKKYVKQKYPEESWITGNIQSIYPFGYFIKIDGEETEAVAFFHKGQYLSDIVFKVNDKIKGRVVGHRGGEVFITDVEKILPN